MGAWLAVRVGEARDRYLMFRAAELRPATIHTIGSATRSFSGFAGELRPLELIDSDVVDDWFVSLDVAPSTLRTMVSAVRVWFGWMCDRGWITRDPTRLLPKVRTPRALPRALDADQVRAVWDACDERTRLIVSLMLHEGLRRGEVARLDWAHVRAHDRTLVVRGKGGHERAVPVSEPTWQLLAASGERSGPVVRSLSHPDDGLTAGTVAHLVRGTMIAAGVDATAHCLRHTAATDALHAGCDIRTVQKFLGHSTVTTTERYLPWEVDDLRRAVDARQYSFL